MELALCSVESTADEAGARFGGSTADEAGADEAAAWSAFKSSVIVALNQSSSPSKESSRQSMLGASESDDDSVGSGIGFGGLKNFAAVGSETFPPVET